MSERMRIRIMALGLLVVVFASGGVVGVAVDRSVAQAAPESGSVPVPAEERVVSPEVSTPLRESGGWIIDRIDVAEDQREGIEDVIERALRVMDERVEACEESYREVIERARAEVRELLDEDQRAEFDRLAEGGG